MIDTRNTFNCIVTEIWDHFDPNGHRKEIYQIPYPSDSQNMNQDEALFSQYDINNCDNSNRKDIPF